MSQDAPKDEPREHDDTNSAESEQDPADSTPPSSAEESRTDAASDQRPMSRRAVRWERRRTNIREEIERNRRGDYKVPTWVLVVILVFIVGGWAALIIFA